MTESFFAMNTYHSITTYGELPKELIQQVKEDLAELEHLWSVSDHESEIYAVNHAEGDTMELHPATADLIQDSLEMSVLTKGALDITTYPILTAWGFTTSEHQIPSEEQIAALMECVGFEKVILREQTIQLPQGMQIDLGAVAKGYACDQAAERFQKAGITSAIINMGGAIRLIGSKPDGSDFQIAVEHPGNRDSLGFLSLSDTNVVTSGAYERYFIGEDGKKYGHILDPHTGYPAESGLASVTIIGDKNLKCDALSTAIFVMGLERAEQLWRREGDFEMLMVTDEQEIYVTENLAEHFLLADEYQSMPIYILEF